MDGLFFRHRLVVTPSAPLRVLPPTCAAWLGIVSCEIFPEFTRLSLPAHAGRHLIAKCTGVSSPTSFSDCAMSSDERRQHNPGCYRAVLYLRICTSPCSSDYLITFAGVARSWCFTVRSGLHALVVEPSPHSCGAWLRIVFGFTRSGFPAIHAI